MPVGVLAVIRNRFGVSQEAAPEAERMVIASLERAREEGRRDWRKGLAKRLDYYESDQLQHVRAEMASLFKRSYAARRHLPVALTTLLVNECADVYSEGVHRTFIDADGKELNREDAAILSDRYERLGVNAKLGRAEKVAFLLGGYGIHAQQDPITKLGRLDPILPHAMWEV
ncbi:MAG: hypothetical protein Q8S13_14270, partial [Dehalococcoidia bacterium]|nr:hypothetical protein [Dehalococcoidia bacterium]